MAEELNILLTVITVNYNNVEGLKRTLGSVLPQLNAQIDYVVIDGGSSDGSQKVIADVATKLRYWCSEPDGGIYPGMNKGVRNADGRYVIFINSGDVLCPGILGEILPFLNDNVSDIIYGNIRYIDPVKSKSFIHSFPDKVTVSHLYESFLPHPGSFIRRQILVDMPYNEKLRIAADYEFFVKAIMQHGYSTLHLPLTISDFYLGGISDSNKQLHDAERREVIDRLFTPIIADAARLSKIETLDCFPEIQKLSQTRKLHKRIRPLLKAILAVDKLFHKSRK